MQVITGLNVSIAYLRLAIDLHGGFASSPYLLGCSDSDHNRIDDCDWCLFEEKGYKGLKYAYG
jgi:hypothetical protein